MRSMNCNHASTLPFGIPDGHPQLCHPYTLAAGVDVSCTKKGDSFRGDQANRQHVNLRLMDMVDLAEANEVGKPHWAAAEVSGPAVY